MKKIVIVLVSVFLVFSCSKAEMFYVTNVNIVDVETGAIIENQTIEIEDGVIISIAADVKLPSDSRNVFDASQLFVTPGLTDMSVYLRDKHIDLKYWETHPGDRMLAAGVTTFRASAYIGYPGALVENEEAYRGNDTVGPEIIKPLRVNYKTGTEPESIDYGMKRNDADYAIMQWVIPEKEMTSILKYTDQHDIYTCANLFRFNDFLICSSLGLDELNKVSVISMLLVEPEIVETVDWLEDYDYLEKLDLYYSQFYELSDEEVLAEIAPVLNEIIGVMKEKDISVTTHLFVDEISAMKIKDPDKYVEYAVENRLPEYIDYIYLLTKEVFGDHFRLELVPDYVVFKERLGKIILKRLYQEGIMITAGTAFSSNSYYGLAPGGALHDELRILSQCGFSSLEALQTATLNVSKVAERMGIEQRWGRVAPGCNADLVFTGANPLDDLSILRQPVHVMKSGIMYTDELLQALR